MGKIPKDSIKKQREAHEVPSVFNFIPLSVYRAFLFIAQYALKYFLILGTVISEFRRVYSFSSRKFGGGLTIDHLTRDLGNLSKLPKHMSFVINEDVEPDYCDLANLVVWTIAMGIPYITLYQRHGVLKGCQSQLGELITSKLGQLFGKDRLKGVDVVVKDSEQTYKNGITPMERYLQQTSKLAILLEHRYAC